jgi:hypothetical protein
MSHGSSDIWYSNLMNIFPLQIFFKRIHSQHQQKKRKAIDSIRHDQLTYHWCSNQRAVTVLLSEKLMN